MIVLVVNFTINPTNATIFAGISGILHCGLMAYPYANLTWYKDDNAIPSDKYSTKSSNVGTYVKLTSNLGFSSVKISDSGRYQCKAINELGEFLSQEAFITVYCKCIVIVKHCAKFDD